MADLPTYVYQQVWALLRRESERDGQPADNHRKRAHKGRMAVTESNQRWCSAQTASSIIRIVLWDIAHHVNIYAGSYRNRKRAKTSGYIGSNPHKH